MMGGAATSAIWDGPKRAARVSARSSHAPSLISVVLLIAMLPLATGCGSEDRSEGSAASQQRSTEPPRASAVTETTPDEYTTALSGSFEAELEARGYTVRIGYDIDTLDLDVDVADAEPGEALLVPQASGRLTIANTTTDRNTEFAIAQPVVGALWEASALPGDVRSVFDEAEQELCGLELGSARYCTLARVRFDSHGPATLAPDEEIRLPVVAPLPRTILGGDVLVVPEDGAETVADFVVATAPDLLWVNSDITGARPSPIWSCVTNESFQGAAQAGFLAILDRDGEALIEGGGVGWYEKGGEPCSIGGGENGSTGPSAAETVGEATGTQARAQPRRRRGPATYTVRPGDTPGAIAARTGVPVERLQGLNPELDPQALIVGQEIALRE